MKVLGFYLTWLHKKVVTLNGVGTVTTGEEFDTVTTRCVHSHENPEKTHPLSVSQACQAQLRMTQHVRDGSITLDEYDTESLEVARRVETGLFS